MSNAVYTPILKTKRGESKALTYLDEQVKQSIIPFFDVLALKSDAANGSDVHEHVLKQALNVAAAWKGRGICYVDFFDVVPSARGLNGSHPVSIVNAKLSAEQVRMIPVVGLERDVAYKLAIRHVLQQGTEAVAVRLDAEDIQLPNLLPNRISELLSEIGASGAAIHVFLDFRDVNGQLPSLLQSLANRAIGELRPMNPQRIVFAASAMASDMSKFRRDSLNRVARTDLLAWRAIAGLHGDVQFGDYGVVHPDYFDFDPRLIKPAAKIRYTSDDCWVVVKGSCWRDDTAQHHRLSQMLARSPEFRGSDSWGGEYISSAAAGRSKYGTLETWVSIDQNNHVSHTARQLSRARNTGVRA